MLFFVVDLFYKEQVRSVADQATVIIMCGSVLKL